MSIGTKHARAVGTRSGDDEIDAVCGETVAFMEVRPDPVHQLSRMVPDGTAAFAHEVELVVGMGDLPSCRLVDAEMGATHQIEFLEDGEGAVDGGTIDRGVSIVDAFGDFVGREVPVGGTQHGPDEPTGAGQAIAVLPKDVTDVGGGGHATSVRVEQPKCD